MKVYNQQSDNKMNLKLRETLNEIRKKRNFDPKDYVERKSEIINRYMTKSHLSACVVAISGGIDSAIVLSIINYASKKENSPIKKIVPLLLPIQKSIGVTNQKDATKRGIALCENLNMHFHIMDLSIINAQIRDAVEHSLGIQGEAWAIGQLGPYSRTPMLYYTTSLLTQEGYSSIICGTTNKDEGTYLGYIGKASDGMVDVQIISDIHKSEVYKVGKFLNVPQSIMDVPPSGDMYDNRTDETVFGASYDFVELYLNYLTWNQEKKNNFINGLSEEDRKQFNFYGNNIENLHKYNLHKYIACSPAVHLDLYDSSIPGGWEGYYERCQKYLNEE